MSVGQGAERGLGSSGHSKIASALCCRLHPPPNTPHQKGQKKLDEFTG